MPGHLSNSNDHRKINREGSHHDGRKLKLVADNAIMTQREGIYRTQDCGDANRWQLMAP